MLTPQFCENPVRCCRRMEGAHFTGAPRRWPINANTIAGRDHKARRDFPHLYSRLGGSAAGKSVTEERGADLPKSIVLPHRHSG